MFCKNCGTEINDNEKYCHKCGTENNIIKGNNYSSIYTSDTIVTSKVVNKKIIIGFVAVLSIALIVIIAVVTNNNNPEKQIIGTWQFSSVSYDSDFENYPESEYITFLGDGTGYFDGDVDETFTYHIDDNTIIMDSEEWLATYTYFFEIEGKEMSLKYFDDDPIFYNKINESEIRVDNNIESDTYIPMKTVEGEPRWSN